MKIQTAEEIQKNTLKEKLLKYSPFYQQICSKTFKEKQCLLYVSGRDCDFAEALNKILTKILKRKKLFLLNYKINIGALA